jgi:hypothetical protein
MDTRMVNEHRAQDLRGRAMAFEAAAAGRVVASVLALMATLSLLAILILAQGSVALGSTDSAASGA